MNDWGIGSYLLAALLLVGIFNESIKSWWFNRLLHKTIAFDRICRLADIGQKDLSYEIIQSYRYSQGSANGRRFLVQFIYANPKARTGTNPNIYAGDAQYVDTLRDATGVEERIAHSILDIKKRYAVEIDTQRNQC